MNRRSLIATASATALLPVMAVVPSFGATVPPLRYRRKDGTLAPCPRANGEYDDRAAYFAVHDFGPGAVVSAEFFLLKDEEVSVYPNEFNYSDENEHHFQSYSYNGSFFGAW